MKKLLALLAFIASFSAFSYGQGVRIGDDRPIVTITTIAGQAGNFLQSVSTATINVCSAPANAVPCTNKATTYTNSTLASSCSSSTQLVLAGTSSCVGTTDIYGNWGAWVSPGQYEYTVTINGASSGPYPLTAGVAAGQAGTGVILTGNAGFIPFYATSGTTLSPDPNLSDINSSLVYTGTRFSVGGATLGTGLINLNGNTSGTVGLTVNAAAGNWNLTLPTTAGSAGQVLSTDGTGVTSWANPGSGSGGVGTGAVNQLAIFNTTSSVIGDTGLSHDSGQGILQFTTATNQGGLNLTGTYTSGGTGPSIFTTGTVTTLGQGLSLIIGANQGGTGTNPAGGNLQLQSGAAGTAAKGGDVLVNTGSGTNFGGSMLFTYGSSTAGTAGHFTVTGPSSLSVGTNFDQGGTINLKHSSSSAVIIGNNSPQVSGLLEIYNGANNYLGIKAPAGLASWTLTLPPNPGTNGFVLATDGAGVTSWVAQTGGGGGVTGSGTSGKIPKWSAATLLADSGISDSGTVVSTAETLAAIASSAATSGANVNSPLFQITGNYWTGAASAADTWSLQNIAGAGTNPTETLTLTHSGSSGTASFSSALPFTLSGGLALSGGTVNATTATKTAVFIVGTGVPNNATCTIDGQGYWRTDAADPGNPMYWCKSGTWTAQTTSGGAGAWNSLSNAGGNMAVTLGNFTTTFTMGAATSSTPWLIQDTTNNVGTTSLFNIATATGSAAQGLSVTVQSGGTAATFQAGSAGYAIKVPSGQGNIGFNRLVSTSANAPTSGCSVCFGATDAVKYWNGSLSQAMVLAAGGGAGPAQIGDTPGIALAGALTTVTAGGALSFQPLAATGNNNGGDITIGGGAGAGTGSNGNIHLSVPTTGTGKIGVIDIGTAPLGIVVANDATTPPIANGLVVYNTASNAVVNQQHPSGVVGICLQNPSFPNSCTSSGSSFIARVGLAPCIFDSVPVTVGDAVGASQANPGQCTDLGVATNLITSNVQTIGIVKALIASGTNPTYQVDLTLGGSPLSTAQFVLKSTNTNQIITTGVTTITPLEVDCASGSTAACFIVKDKNGNAALTVNASGITTFGTTFGAMTATNFVSASANPASQGVLELANTDKVCWRNNANSGDICLSKNASDSLVVPTANAGSSSVLAFATTNLVNLLVNNPAATRNITLGDPGGNDSVAYLAATQSFTNKTYTNAIFDTPTTWTEAAAPGSPSAGKLAIYAKTGDAFCMKNSGGTETCFGTGGGGSAWGTLTNPAGNQSLSMSTFTTTFTWGAATGAGVNLFTLTDTLNNTGTGYLLADDLASGSAAKPAKFAVNGNGVEVTNGGVLQKLGTGSVKADAFSGSVPIANGGTAGTTATTGFDNLSPLTTLGDIVYHDGTHNVRLGGTTANAMSVLTQTGTGVVSAAPAWTGTSGTGNIARVNGPALTSTNLIAASAGNTITLACKSVAPGTVTPSSGVDTSIISCTVPANTIGANGCLRFEASWRHTTGSTTSVYKWFVDSTNIQAYTTSTATTAFHAYAKICDNGATNAQVQDGGVMFNATTTSQGASGGTQAFDMTASHTVKLMVNVASGTDVYTGDILTVNVEQ